MSWAGSFAEVHDTFAARKIVKGKSGPSLDDTAKGSTRSATLAATTCAQFAGESSSHFRSLSGLSIRSTPAIISPILKWRNCNLFNCLDTPSEKL
jgi:hypothetical protein